MKTPQNSQWIGQSYDVGFRLFHDHGWGGYPFFEQTWWSWNLWLTEKKMQRGREAKRQRVCFRFWFHQQLAFSGSDWDFLVSKLQRNIDPKWVPWHPWHPLVPGRISKGESGNWTLVDLHARQHFRRRGSYLISSQAEEKCHPVAVIMQPWDSWDWSKKISFILLVIRGKAMRVSLPYHPWLMMLMVAELFGWCAGRFLLLYLWGTLSIQGFSFKAVSDTPTLHTWLYSLLTSWFNVGNSPVNPMRIGKIIDWSYMSLMHPHAISFILPQSPLLGNLNPHLYF